MGAEVIRWSGTDVDTHTHAILAEAGLSAEERKALADEGITPPLG